MFDHALALAAQRRLLATELTAMNKEDRRAHVHDTAIETGGCVIYPRPNSNTGNLFVEVSLLDLYADGATLDETINNWIKIALRAAPIPTNFEEDHAA